MLTLFLEYVSFVKVDLEIVKHVLIQAIVYHVQEIIIFLLAHQHVLTILNAEMDIIPILLKINV